MNLDPELKKEVDEITKKIMSTIHLIDRDKIDRIKERINSGYYESEKVFEEIAERLMEEMKNEF